MQVGFIHQCVITGKRYHTGADLHIVCTQANQLLCQYILQLSHRFGDHGKFFNMSGRSLFRS